MKTEIQKILEMAKSGTITDEQATQLIEELMKAEVKSSPRAQMKSESMASTMSDFIRNTVSAAMDGGSMKYWSGHSDSNHFHGDIHASDMKNNTIQLSKMDSPRGDGYIFKENLINMSHISGLQLNHGEMLGNRVDASKVEELHITNAKMENSKIQASALEGIYLEHGEIVDAQILASKCVQLHISGESYLQNVKVNGCSIKNFKVMQESKMKEIVWNGAAVTSFSAQGSQFYSCEIHSSRLNEIHFESSDLKDVLLRSIKMSQTTFSKSKFSDVVFTSTEGWSWKKQGFTDVRFENCDFLGVLFSDCRLKNTVIRNVSLQKIQVKGLDLSGQVIDGNEAFQSLLRQERSSTTQAS